MMVTCRQCRRILPQFQYVDVEVDQRLELTPTGPERVPVTQSRPVCPECGADQTEEAAADHAG